MGHTYMGHHYSDHSYIGQNYIGHEYIGHDYIGHNYIGHNFIGHNYYRPPVGTDRLQVRLDVRLYRAYIMYMMICTHGPIKVWPIVMTIYSHGLYRYGSYSYGLSSNAL